MVRKELFDYYGLFDENFLCCEDYEFWLRIGAKENFLLIDRPLTVKHGGRDDQVSSIYRMGMDTYRIAALEKNIQSKEFSHWKRSCMVQECIRRCTIYANGCGKHGQTEEEEKYIAKLNQLKKMLVELNRENAHEVVIILHLFYSSQMMDSYVLLHNVLIIKACSLKFVSYIAGDFYINKRGDIHG